MMITSMPLIDRVGDRAGQHVEIGQRGDDAVGARGRRLLDDARHVGEVAGRRVAVLDLDAHLLAGERDAVLDGVPPAVAVGGVADEHIALAFGLREVPAQERRGGQRRP
jgi:hypothetical protein